MSFDSEGNSRAEPLQFKPTTLPHRILDEGAGGEGIGFDLPSNDKSTNTPTPSTTNLVRTASQTSQTRGYFRLNNDSFPKVFQFSVRLAFYLIVLVITIGLTLAACKFTNTWDPCENLYVISTECKVTSYMKGMVYHSECTEERSCILPGFESNIKRQEWTLQKPNTTTAMAPNSILYPENPTQQPNQ